MTTTDIGIIRAKASEYVPGHSLDRLFYTSQSVYELDLVNVWCESWLWAGHVSQVENVGDYFLFEFGTESIIVVRDEQGEIRAHTNVCRHRGSRVCQTESGNAKRFTCPYHAWTYGLDGVLRIGRMMGDDFDPSSYRLWPVHVFAFQGLIFVSLAEEPPALEPALKKLEPLVAPFGLAQTKIAHKTSYRVPANWKLTVENYLECYHCAPSHKEYSRSHSLKDPKSMTKELVEQMQTKSIRAGLPIDAVNATGLDAKPLGSDTYVRRYPLYPGYVTGGEQGTPLAPLLGTLTSYDGGATDIQIGPFNYFLAYSDYVVGYHFIPRALQQTDIQTVWLVRRDAVEGEDYQLDQLTWLWDVTTKHDERIIRHNQQGVNSIRYRPGPLAPMEWGISGFLRWYVTMIQ